MINAHIVCKLFFTLCLQDKRVLFLTRTETEVGISAFVKSISLEVGGGEEEVGGGVWWRYFLSQREHKGNWILF
mgnify:CR=1 FL=1